MTASEYTVTPRKAKEYIIDVIQAGLVPFLKSSPGIGKSAILAEVASEFGLKMIDHRLSTSTPEDLSGLPNFVNGKATFMPFDIFPLETDEVPAGYNGWMLFFDEFNSATKSVQAAAYKTILDKMTGQHKLHKQVAMCAAGNLATDRAIVNPLSTAMTSRVITINMVLDNDEFLEDIVVGHGWDSRLSAFLHWKKKYCNDFDPSRNEDTFACPRTLDFLQRMIKGKPVTKDKVGLYAGAITSGVALEFFEFTQYWDKIPKLSEILADPAFTPAPSDIPVQWATMSMLTDEVTEKNFHEIATYLAKFEQEFRVLAFRLMLKKLPELRTHPTYAKSAIDISRFLHGS